MLAGIAVNKDDLFVVSWQVERGTQSLLASVQITVIETLRIPEKLKKLTYVL
jgi:hypothetical protein